MAEYAKAERCDGWCGGLLLLLLPALSVLWVRFEYDEVLTFFNLVMITINQERKGSDPLQTVPMCTGIVLSIIDWDRLDGSSIAQQKEGSDVRVTWDFLLPLLRSESIKRGREQEHIATPVKERSPNARANEARSS
ncbi:hypothetical protein EDC04DRAFT_2611967 [Pisolithus marmoratus]|nr:hypothetical protein EDC04DRAFT_2611967 [Pisolithus marmoratus]